MDNNEMNNSGVGENPSDVNATVDSHYAGTTQDAGYTSYTYTAPDAGSFNGVEETKKGFGIAALILGIVSLIAWSSIPGIPGSNCRSGSWYYRY